MTAELPFLSAKLLSQKWGQKWIITFYKEQSLCRDLKLASQVQAVLSLLHYLLGCTQENSKQALRTLIIHKASVYDPHIYFSTKSYLKE